MPHSREGTIDSAMPMVRFRANVEGVDEIPHAGLPETSPMVTDALHGDEVPVDTTPLVVRLRRHAELHPDRPAVTWGRESLSYAALVRRANGLAHTLRALGAGPNQHVAIRAPRGLDQIAAVWGVLTCGAAYVPLPMSAPPERIAHQLRDMKAVAIVTKLPFVSPLASCTVVSADAGGEAAAPPPLTQDSSDIAYVIFTSGSTGKPKGVSVTHDNLHNYVGFVSHQLDLANEPPWSFASVSTLAADLGNTPLFVSLANGGSLHLVEDVLDARATASQFERVGMDVLKITPSHLEALLASPGGDGVVPRRAVIVGGEALRWSLVDRLRQVSPTVRIINEYGPTETTVGSTVYEVSEPRPDTATVPIGVPIHNTRCHVVNEELLIGGRGVTRGYLERPELTRERFVPEPGRESLAYRTGDRVRQLDSGELEFIGRVDFQLKIRGFRVEPAEVESVLLDHEAVRETVVVGYQDTLVAYVVLRDDAEADAVATHARAHLPDHMVPRLYPLVSFPLNPNGKIDRKALPSPAVAATSSPTDSASETEATLADIVKQLLRVPQVGRHDNFFAIGGNSLAAVHFVARIEQRLGVRVSHGVLVTSPTIAEIAQHIDAGAPSATCLVPMQTAGTRPPLFLVHGGGGHVYFYRDLATRLGTDQPLYALQARVIEGLPPHNTVEDMAEEYLAEIRAVAPHGPYFFGGVSFGGKVALEMAHRVRALGEEVGLLLLLDTWGPGYPAPLAGTTRVHEALYWLYRRIEHHAGSVWFLDRERRREYLSNKTKKAFIETGEAIVDLKTRLTRKKSENLHAGESFIAAASRKYMPKTYDGRTLVVRCASQPLGIHYDRMMGWADLLRGEVDLVEAPGLHAAMVAEPRTRFLVEKINPVLAAAQHAAQGQER